ncbi:MAG: carbon starvation protein A [Acidobacteria bacterium]|nr:carbon starvation protein A [Acidobacteriota bacterium]
MLIIIPVITIVFFAAAYIWYGKFLANRFDIDNRKATPSHTDYDGIDRVPAQRSVLLGHHFSSIAGAGPIIGPILAALAFGWLPALLWILLGSVFIGGVHDFSALVASIRHKARSIAEVAREYMSSFAYKLFLLFIWLTLVYVLTVFTDLTSSTFVQDGGVASSSILFMALAIGFGIAVYRLKVPILWASLIFVPLVFVSVWFGQLIPISAQSIPVLFGNPGKTWDIILLIYCFVASTTPVWILLQPRDYLSSYLLYASVFGGFFGIMLGGFAIQFPAFKTWSDPVLGSLFPILFITVACGACSGFHAVVASGTSSKQIDKETDTRLVGYGGMLIEGIVAVIALAAVTIIGASDSLSSQPPLIVYANGMSKFLSYFGIPVKMGYSFALLALSTFILTSLDTATRLGRYIFEEFFNLKSTKTRYFSTLATVLLPGVFVLITLKDPQGNALPAWKAIWPVFGATNQLLAGLVLLVIAVWLKKMGKKLGFIIVPMLFMNIMTIWALIILIGNYKFSTVGIIACVLLGLAILLVIESYKSIIKSTAGK